MRSCNEKNILWDMLENSYREFGQRPLGGDIRWEIREDI